MTGTIAPATGEGSLSKKRGAIVTTALAALGIVFGDLGTSPLYTYQTIVNDVGGRSSLGDALGLLSLVVWTLIVTISVKYCILVMRADNHGEGGILALMALVSGRGSRAGRAAPALVAVGLFGAALIYGDGIITPAISVLSALEGINVATTFFRPYVMPAALLILLALFAVQSYGTANIGRLFGPIMLLWFITIATLGLVGIVQRPEVLTAIDPRQGVGFLVRHGWRSFLVLGGVFLAITGGEALYADMGNIGRGPIRVSWYGVVLPALLLSYSGQTALLIKTPGFAGNPFFKLAPGWAIIPLVGIATVATIIASQAIITGAFSLARQAMQLGWFPGLSIRQTSDREYGQIYVPFVNWTMMLGTLALTFGFGSSDRLAGAYGTAISTTMLLTTVLLYNAMRDLGHWPRSVALPASGAFLVFDLAFFAANLLKLPEGGWVPLILGIVIFTIMTTWHCGVDAVRRRAAEEEKSPADFLAELKSGITARVPGTAVFLSHGSIRIPLVLLRHVAEMKALQETVVSLTVVFDDIPRIPDAECGELEHIGEGLWRFVVRFGFVEMPSLTAALALAQKQGCPLNLDSAIFFAARDVVVRDMDRPRLTGWRRELFAFMHRNAVRIPDRLDLPADRFLEVGRQVAL
jgi:KUP system potassium uptake protein